MNVGPRLTVMAANQIITMPKRTQCGASNKRAPTLALRLNGFCIKRVSKTNELIEIERHMPTQPLSSDILHLFIQFFDIR